MKHDDDFGGLARDLDTLSRRRMLRFMAKAAAGWSLAPWIGACGDDITADRVDASAGGADSSIDSAADTCARIPSETAGPYPGDGTNGPNALTISGINRSDIRTSVGTASGTAAGIELTVTLTLVSATTCEPVVGYAVYLWQCDRAGDYSMYTGAATGENYLRGVQVTDAAGKVTFTTIFPGCYAGRWPHIHFEVFNAAMTAKVTVSQLALPKEPCDEVYATAGYEQSVMNLAQITLADDNVFRDGTSLQMATVSGSVAGDLTSELTVALAT